MEESVIEESFVRGKSRRLVIAPESFSCRQTHEWLARGTPRLFSVYAFMASTSLHACVIGSLLFCTPTIHRPEMAQVYSVEILPGLPDAWAEEDIPQMVEPETKEPQAPTDNPLLVVEKTEPEERAVEKIADYGGDSSIASELVVGESNYWQSVRTAIARQVRYPCFAQRQRREGYVLIELSIDAQGQLRSIVPLESSSSIFLRSATEAVEKAAPFPPPANRTSDVITAILPIHFRMNHTKEKDDES